MFASWCGPVKRSIRPNPNHFKDLAGGAGAWEAWVEGGGGDSYLSPGLQASSRGVRSMSVVLAVLTSDPNLLKCELARLEGQVVLQAEPKANAVGVGAYEDGEVLLRRLSSDAGLTVGSLAPPHESGALLFHAGRLPVGLSLEDNTQPFRSRGWLFAHQGALNGFDR